MTMAERIFHRIQELPDQEQAEVLDFVEFLEAKKRKTQEQADEKAWSQLALSQAMRRMEEEEEIYSLDDLEAVF